MELSTGWIVFVVYLMGQVDTFVSVVNGVTFLFGIFTFFFFIAVIPIFATEGVNLKPYIKAHWKKVAFVSSTLFFLNACTPSSESVKTMAVAFGASEVLQSDAAKNVATEISKIAGKTADVVNKKLDKALEEK